MADIEHVVEKSAKRSERPVYLHFLNRELARAVNHPLSSEHHGDLVLLTAMSTDTTLLSSIAFVWESGVLDSPLGPAASELIRSDQLALVSDFVTVDGFIQSCQNLYRDDRQRYPMYFETPPVTYMTAKPTLLKSSSTTRELDGNLQSILSGEFYLLRDLPSSDTSRILDSRPEMERVLMARDGRALTLSLFEPKLDRGASLPIGRLLSLLHLRHYLESTAADIVTGVRGLEYFDVLSKGYPRLDTRLTDLIFKSVGLRLATRRTIWEPLVACRALPAHKIFLDLLASMIDGLYYLAREEEPSQPLTKNFTRRLVVERAKRSLSGLSFGPAWTSGLASKPYEVGAERLAHALLTLSQQSRRFREYQERRRLMGVSTSRVLILVATEIERDAIIRRFRGRKENVVLHRNFTRNHTIFHLGIVGSAEVLLAQSEQGTEAPGAMTLTAADLINDCQPEFLVLAGICFGLREDVHAIGDILISSQLRLVDPRKIIGTGGKDREILRGDKISASVTLLDRFRSASADWSGARVHFGLLLSSNTLVNSPMLRNRLRQLEPDAIGGEMEGAGAYAASGKRKVDWIVAKAIADWGQGKTDDMQVVAAENVADYIAHVLATGALAPVASWGS